MKNKDFDFISDKFNEENINAPEALDENEIKARLDRAEDETVIPFKQKKKKWFYAPVAAVACIAIIAVTVTAVNQNVNKPYVSSPDVVSHSEGSDIVEYESYEELEAALEEIRNQRREIYEYEESAMGGTVLKSNSDKATAIADSADSARATGTGGSANESFSSTNKQVDSVDEADIIKTDGRYIYYISNYPSKILIFSAKDGKTKQIAEIKAKNDNLYFSELYLYNNKLVVLGSRTEYNRKRGRLSGIYSSENYSFVYVYDLSDIENPELIDEYEQSGYYNTSRMIGSCVYLISRYGYFDTYFYDDVKTNDFVPCATNAEGETEKLDIEDICGIGGCPAESYCVIGALDVDKGKDSKKTKAMLGVNDNVYCNENNLFITGTSYEIEGDWDSGEITKIVKYSLDKTDVKLEASGQAKGSVNDQFSMDEKDGYLRVALTDYRWNDSKDRNYLYVFDKKLEIIGQTDGFAKGEHVEAVRFIGDTAYVITYEQTDPLFIIDLSNPKEPVIKGEVKIDGFSSFLTPVDENTMLGIGYATTKEEWGIVADGLKLALFDISDKENPQVLDEFELHDADSEAQITHKALTINEDEGYYAIPVLCYGEDDFTNGVFVIRINDGELDVEQLETDSDEYIKRCVYIGDYIYAPIDDGSEVYSFKVK